MAQAEKQEDQEKDSIVQEEQQQQQQENRDTAVPSPGSDQGTEFTQTVAEELLRYEEVVRRCCTWRHDDLDPQLLTDILQITIHGTSFSYQTAAQLSKVLDNRAKACFTLLQEFQALSRADQAAVLDNNLPL